MLPKAVKAVLVIIGLALVLAATHVLATTIQATIYFMAFQPATNAIQFSNSAYQMPQCTISSNPYGGATGTYGLLNCLAIQHNGTWAVIRFYYQSGEEGVILWFGNGQYPSTPYHVLWVYIGTNGYLYFADWDTTTGSAVYVDFPLTPGWHTLVAGEYYSGGTYYLVAYLDSTSNTASTSTTNPLSLFVGLSGDAPYSDIGAGYDSNNNFPNSPNTWFFFNGYIQYIALYAGNSSTLENDLLNWLNSTGGSSLPPSLGSPYGPYALYTLQSFAGSTWNDASGNGNNAVLVSGTSAASVTTLQNTFTQIPVSGDITCSGTTTSFSNLASESCTSSGYDVYVKVTSLPSGYGSTWDASVNSWAQNYNYTISSNGTYYLIVATPEVSVNNPPNSNLPYYETLLELQAALVTSLPSPSSIYLVFEGTGILTPAIGGCCVYTPPVQLLTPQYYLTSSGTYASGTPLGTGFAGYGAGYFAIYTNIIEPIPMIINLAYYYQFALPGYGFSYPNQPQIYGFAFYAPPPSGWYWNYYFPSSSSSYSVNQPETVEIQFTVVGQSTSGTLLDVSGSNTGFGPTIMYFFNNATGNYVSIPNSNWVYPVQTGDTYTIMIIINPSHNEPISIFVNGVNVTTSPLWTNSPGSQQPYLWIGDGYYGPLQGVEIGYIAIWLDQATTSPSGNPTFLFSGEGSNPIPWVGDAITVYPGWPIYVWTGSSAIELYTGSSFNYNFTYPEPAAGTGSVSVGAYIGPLVALDYTNPYTVIISNVNGGTFNNYCGFPTVYISSITGLIAMKYPLIVYTGQWYNEYGTGTFPASDFTEGSGDFSPTGFTYGACGGATQPSSAPVFYIPNYPPAQTSYFVVPLPNHGGSLPQGTYIGHSLVPSLSFNVLTINYPCSTSLPSTLDSTSLAYYFSNGTLFVSGSITPVNPVYFDTSPTGYLLWNNTFIVIPGLMQYEPGISSIAIADSATYTQITLDLGTYSGGSVAWAPLLAIQGVIGSGQLAFGDIFQSIGQEGSYYSYTIQVPTCALGKPAMVYVYSYKTTSFTNLTVTIQNPLYLVLSGEGVATPPIATASTTVTVNVVTPAPTPKPFILPPPSMNAQVMFLLPFAAASLIILMVRKHASLMAGLMLAGLITIAVGVVLGIIMMFAAGLLMFIIGAAWAMAWRKQP